MASLFPSSSPPPVLNHGAGRRLSALFAAASTAPSFSSAAPARDAIRVQFPLGDLQVPQRDRSPLLVGSSAGDGGGGDRNEFYLNLGMAVRTLREDLPLIFSRDLNYDIYRADITFSDPLNAFHGIDNYRLIFWALRFHGRMLFREISLDVLRVWQLSDDVILIRWNLKGVPRVPWEARGEFQGTSRYKLDRRGKIYDHRVDNLAVNFPKMAVRAPGSAAVLDLVAPSPCPPIALFVPDGRWLRLCCGGAAVPHRCSWLAFYQAVENTLDQGKHLVADEAPLYMDRNELSSPCLPSLCSP